jgi:hypothetical protein
MVGVPEDDLGPEILEVAMGDGLDGTARADRHEHRCLHDTMRRPEFSPARQPLAMGDGELERH